MSATYRARYAAALYTPKTDKVAYPLEQPKKLVPCHVCGKSLKPLAAGTKRLPGIGTVRFCRHGCTP